MQETKAPAPKRTVPAALLVLLLFVDIFLMATFKVGDYDTWYYLAAGRHIAATGSLRHEEPFAYTVPGTPWHTQTWLASVLFYAVHSVTGIPGLILFNALVVTAIFLLVLLAMRPYAKSWDDLPLAAGLTLLAALGARFRFMVRPHILEFLYLAAILSLLHRHRVRGGKAILLVPLLQVLWVNSHGSHILGLALPALFAAGSFLNAGLRRAPEERAAQRRAGGAFALTFLAGAAATLLSPSTYRAFIFPFSIVGQGEYMKRIAEWQPLRLASFAGYGLRFTWAFAVLALLAVIALVRRWRRPDFVGILLFAVFLVQAVRGIRLTAEFVIAVAPIVFANLAGAPTRPRISAGRVLPALALLGALLAVPPMVVTGRSFTFGFGVKERRFPVRAVEFVQRNGIRGRMFNSFAFGDYLCWATAPERKVFIHGRNDIFPAELFLLHFDAERSAEGWAKVEERFGVTYAIVRYVALDYTGAPRVDHLASNPGWLPVFWDASAVVYVKDIPENQLVIERFGYRYLRPAYFNFNYLLALLDKGIVDPIIAECDRHLAESPGDEETHLARSIVVYDKGPAFSGRAIADVKAALAVNPRRAISHAVLGTLYQREGRSREAEEEYRAALRIDPGEPTALMRLKALGMPAGTGMR